MNVRVYLKLDGFTIGKHPQGCHFLTLEVDGAQVQQSLWFEDGHFYINVNAINPNVPKILRSRVICVTSRDHIHGGGEQHKLLKPGTYTSRSGKGYAEIREEIVSGRMGLTVDIRCRSIKAWQQFRPTVLANQARRTRAYIPAPKLAAAAA